ncbi:alpha,alpha-phosphotrehalase [Streptococcus danieliae]|uniref:Alpha,alpha-phosphotrehalase n=2 Tax=Streptococcus danieliae TaxID=747656 RepID=A0A7Z0M6M3_9STRE|nr:alpha,alpha-phosphotrehalase [Streptococcus danieliae]MBF0699567.1 alpha,alpha-phosphotrehalase [Streptococcus danieliae]NYS96743.1 alpha,alpha-phosphotrehalase [Streptococcus danieliae]
MNDSLFSKVVYQIYPKSFKDSNGDGFGDLSGILEKLPYLKKLGVDILWLNPFYVSPQNDNGYDIADYRAIDPRFGTMEDFEELARQAKTMGMGIMLDMVLNHTSTEHEWFQKALAGDKRYQTYYYIRDPKANGSLPTNWQSKFGGPAWQPFGDTGKYYMNLYDKTQADLDWHNPEVRKELYDVVNFWREKGASGFRFDVINVIGKDELLVDSVNDQQEKSLYTDTPIVHDYLQELNQNSFGQDPNIVTVGEMSSTTIENCILYTRPDRHELSMTFSFHHLKVDYKDGDKWQNQAMDFAELKRILNDWQVGMDQGGGCNAVFWNNHDQPRALTRFTNDGPYRVESAKMLAQTIHMMKGVPYIYMGEEIGMTDPGFTSMEQYKDIESINAYQMLLERGLSEAEALEVIQVKSRDNSRTPIQWNDQAYAGFSTSQPWLEVASNYPDINVEKELAQGTIFPYYQELIRLRKELPIIQEGSYQPLLVDHPQVLAYKRQLGDQELLVFNNFYEQATTISLENTDYSYLLGNYGERKASSQLELRPYETIAFLSR